MRGTELCDGNAGRRLASLLCAAATVLAAGMLSSCSKPTAGGDGAKAAKDKPVSVSIGSVTTRSVPLEIKTFGSVEAAATVAVKAEVNGALTAVHFQKGQSLKKGDKLFTIDPRPYQAALDQAKATLAKDTVQAQFARADANRSGQLLTKGVAAQSDYEKSQTDAASLEASMEADKAAIQTAQLQLEHCFITSPVNGPAGNLLVDVGNIVKAQDMTMVVINQVQPIIVAFSVSQGDLPAIRKRMAASKLQVKATFPGQEAEAETGELTFIDNTIDKTTGTILLRAQFANERERLWPGQYVDVSLTLDVQTTTVVPARAVQTGRAGKYVYVVGSNRKVALRPVIVRRSSETEMVVEQGLTAGEQVITDGQFQLVDGAKVEARSAAGEKVGGKESSASQAASPESSASRPAETPATKPSPAGRGGRE